MRRNSISVFEHDTLKVGCVYGGTAFKRHHLDSLEQFFGDKGTSFFSMVHNGVRFCEYVGVIQVGNLTIEVLPKADKQGNEDHWRRILLGMLRKVGLFDIKTPSQANLKLKPNHLLDLYFELFISEVESLRHHGLVKKYRKEESNLNSLKGSLNFSKHVRANAVHQERFYTRHTIYSQDNPLNRVLLKTIRLINNISINPALSSRIGALLLDYPEMEDIRVSETWFTHLCYSRKTEHYRKALDIARLLLLNYHPDLRGGRDHVLALMFDMNLLWEKFVYVSLRRYMQEEEIRAQVSKPYWKLDDYRPVHLKPDILITRGEQSIVIDTKWKILNNNRPSDDDLRQVYAYSKYWNTERTILLYPGIGTLLNGHFFDEQDGSKAKLCSLITIGIYPGIMINKLQNEISLRIGEIINV